MSGLFITGTDTGVGKTHIATRLAAIWRNESIDVGVFKPAESGCVNGHPEDAEKLLAAARSGQTLEEVCPYRLSAPLAPAVAAIQEGVSIDFLDIHDRIERLKDQFEYLLIEGAGGILVPLTNKASYLDMAIAAGVPVLIVVGNKLGCINHALLTERACLSSGVKVLGMTLNDLSGTKSPDMLSNPEEIERLAHSPMLGTWPYRTNREPDDVTDQERRLAMNILEALKASPTG